MSVDTAARRAEWEALSKEEQIERAAEFAADLLSNDMLIGGATMVDTILGLFDEGHTGHTVENQLRLMQLEFKQLGIKVGN